MNKEMKKLTDDTLEAYEQILTPEAFRLVKIMVGREEKRSQWVSPGYISHIIREIAYRKEKKNKKKS
jgi:succinate dehydrogenase flavin-adding protein (antitoxin of CptAB toxin-antitoxin module)